MLALRIEVALDKLAHMALPAFSLRRTARDVGNNSVTVNRIGLPGCDPACILGAQMACCTQATWPILP